MTRLTMKLSIGLGTLKLFFIMSSTSLNYYTTPEFICPDVSYIEESALMNCSTSTPYTALQYTGPRSTPGPQCIASLQLCTPIGGYNASIINQTHSSLRILTVEPHHAGQWTCADIPNGPLASCDVVITKTPTCSINSTEDTDVLALYQELSLTVDIRDYFCSAAFNFSLQTGNVSTLLLGAEHVANVTDNITAVTLNVTKSHLGIVGLIFSCHTKQRNTTCDGVTELKTPTCSISSDKDTDRLDLNEELTLSVDIIGYNCPVASHFTLQTGNVQQLLDGSDAEAGFDRAAQTFNVTETHLGGVRLIFNCQHRHWNLTCDGITDLREKIKTSDVLATASTPVIAACVVGAIVFLIIVVLIVFLIKRKQVTQIKPQPSLKPSSPPYITVGTPGSSAYATVELNDAPSGSKNITVIDAGGYACAGDFVNNADTRSSSLTKDGSHELSMAKTSTDNPKNDLGVVVQHIVPEENRSQINELYASINKTKDMTVHNDDTAI
ncbi:uncharacterized protein LOC125375939 isoform X4 [Haliotis rufescens]|uniref:uncharacterized protein LOC125375939 isoform X4 n=1 Tax=Haliotis rufescens TaxID=6454 RepID=UPI00201EB89D|nr:uncharacterized protein LOC125375939 isoform X4 [Haliotis rufescens]XP_048242958.1 uncharacterized protein LOC125375939 isoform X4 [Haliotis rufescens]